ncbi:mucin-3A-like isoform X2 [Ctenopharyngodon idella]|uniref:mucin-3A-like isoform X2 n=1 Tax=Ctenopharyngodon idella TaxID=7959 RepID=UPI0022329DD6|nr:mucin-3A-like isoform X2 [Ctenopharyngodon idella]
MELFIFIAFLLLMEVQSYKSPAVKVSPDVIRESSSVKMICEMLPADVAVKQCYFYINRGKEKNIKVSPSCELNLTGAEVLIWAAVKSPASININCFYTIHKHGIDKPSSHSPAATVTVLGSLQKPTMSVSDDDVQINIACEILLSVRVDFICRLYTEDGLLRTSYSQGKQSGGHLCMFYSSHSELLTGSENRQLSCDYSLNTEPEIRSPRSDTITVRAPDAHHVTTAKKTSLPLMSTSETYSTADSHSKSNLSTTSEETTSPDAHHVTTAKKTSLPLMSTSETYSSAVDSHSKSNLPTTSEETTFSTPATNAHVTPAMTTYSFSKSNLPTSTTKETTFSTTSTQKTSQRDTKISIMAAVSTTKTPESTRTDTWFIALVSTAAGVILIGLICLCCFACKKRTRKSNKMRSITSDVPSQEIGMSSGPAETYSLITSVPATSQPISVGLEHPDSHQDNTPDPTATYSFVMSDNSMYQPSDVLVNKQQTEGSTKENENVYHLYCTIPDKPVHSNAADQVYSLVKMH